MELIQTGLVNSVLRTDGSKSNVTAIDDDEVREFLNRYELISEEKREHCTVGVYRRKQNAA